MFQNVLKDKVLKYKGTKGYIKCYGKLGIFLSFQKYLHSLRRMNKKKFPKSLPYEIEFFLTVKN